MVEMFAKKCRACDVVINPDTDAVLCQRCKTEVDKEIQALEEEDAALCAIVPLLRQEGLIGPGKLRPFSEPFDTTFLNLLNELSDETIPKTEEAWSLWAQSVALPKFKASIRAP
jgi:hypothetical protein